MCDSCGCTLHSGDEHATAGDSNTIEILQGLLQKNDHQALHNRQHLDQQQLLTINLMSSPGAGKTALLEATIEALGEQIRIGVIEGDLETENDAERIRSKGVPACQITTGSACHLDAAMVHQALHQMPLQELDLLFIENVGNLVCPASFDLGQHHNVTLLSVTEGDDKPVKYPVIFRASDLVLLTKMDLLPFLDDFSPERARESLQQLANPAELLALSAKSGEGMEAWCQWINSTLHHYRSAELQRSGSAPSIEATG